MKKNHRILLLLTVLCLCAALGLSALAEGVVSTLYQSGTRLLFDTDNAALTVHGEFSYNGVPFKTADVVYLQDGVNSSYDLKLLTPKSNGELARSGFTVVGNGDTAYSVDPVDNPYVYNTSACAESSSILSSSVLRRALVRLGSAAVSMTENSFADKITVAAGTDETTYHVQLHEGQTPALINAAGTLLWQLAAQRYFYVYYDYMAEAQQAKADHEVMIAYDDYTATFAWQYKQLFNEELPENFYELIWSESGEESARAAERNQQVQNAIEEGIAAPLRAEYEGGVAVIRGDGSYDYYETTDQYYVDNDLQMVDFADFDAAYCAYYQKVTGSELTRQDLNAIYHSDNEELGQAFSDIYDQMMAEYLDLVRKDGKAALIYVNADGSYRMVYDYDAYSRTQFYGDETMTRNILRNMEQIELGNSDFTLTLDAENRVTGAQGTLGLVVIDQAGYRNKLDVNFDIAVNQYGETHVDAFDPAARGLMTYQEYTEKGPDSLQKPADDQEETFPETVVFDGVSYQVILDQPDGGDV